MTDTSPNFLRRLFGERAITVESESPEVLTLKYGGLRTVFDRGSSKIFQNGKLVGVLSLVERVQLHKPSQQEGTANWYVTVHLKGARQVEIGQTTDRTDASLIGAHIATLTGRPVIVDP
jgi:hypothetical protein